MIMSHNVRPIVFVPKTSINHMREHDADLLEIMARAVCYLRGGAEMAEIIFLTGKMDLPAEEFAKRAEEHLRYLGWADEKFRMGKSLRSGAPLNTWNLMREVVDKEPMPTD